jgi:hypothetical protein
MSSLKSLKPSFQNIPDYKAGVNWQISHLYAISTLHRYLSRNNPAFNRCYTIYALEKELISCLKATHVQERHVCSKINTLPSVSAHMNYMHQKTHHGTLDGIMAGTAVLTHPHGERYCNVFAGSISQWKFITLKTQYTTVNYNQYFL